MLYETRCEVYYRKRDMQEQDKKMEERKKQLGQIQTQYAKVLDLLTG